MLERRSFLRCCFELLAPPCEYKGGGGGGGGGDCHLLLVNGVDALLLSDGVSFLLTAQCGGGMATVHYCEGFTFPWTGQDMAGMAVTATFSDTTTETVTWASLGSGAGHAAGVINNWSISEGGDTQSNNWTLSNNSGKGIVSVVIDGEAGSGTTSATIFNTTLGGGKTAGSDTGQTFLKNGGNSSVPVSASYQTPVALIGASPIGDLYTAMTITFTGGGLLSSTQITFAAGTIGCGVGAFGPVAPAILVWHVDCEFSIYKSLMPNVPPSSGDAVVLWKDLQGTGNDLVPLHVPLNTGSQVTNYQTGATGTGRPNVQVGSDWRAIFQGSFNFFTAAGQWSYAVFYRAASTHIALIDDGTPATNGLAMGYGNPNLDTGGGGALMMGIKDGIGSTENTGIAALGVGVIVVTYDGTAGGATNYYFLDANLANNGGQVNASATFTQLGKNASGGFALGGTHGNADPNRLDTSLSLCEAAVWKGILTPTQLQELADRGFSYWGYT